MVFVVTLWVSCGCSIWFFVFVLSLFWVLYLLMGSMMVFHFCQSMLLFRLLLARLFFPIFALRSFLFSSGYPMGIVLFKVYFGFSLWFKYLFGVCFLRLFGVAKVRLFVRVRNNNKGSYIASVPLKQLVKLSGYPKTRWSFEDGWLILEAF